MTTLVGYCELQTKQGRNFGFFGRVRVLLEKVEGSGLLASAILLKDGQYLCELKYLAIKRIATVTSLRALF